MSKSPFKDSDIAKQIENGFDNATLKKIQSLPITSLMDVLYQVAKVALENETKFRKMKEENVNESIYETAKSILLNEKIKGLIEPTWIDDAIQAGKVKVKDAFYEGFNWLSGTWIDGTWLQGNWKGGTWRKGTWNKGTWEIGLWKDGTWKKGFFLAGTWEKGTWKDGFHTDGTWKGGTWEKGTWHGGQWQGGTFEGGDWMTGIWTGGTFDGGVWYGGQWKGGTWKKGKISSAKYYKGSDNYLIPSSVDPNKFRELEKKSSNVKELIQMVK